MGRQYGKTPYQVALRWIVQQEVAFARHSLNRQHLDDDLAIFDFHLTKEEMARLTRISEAAPLYY